MSGSIPTLTPGLEVCFIGKDSSEISKEFNLKNSPLEESDCAIFIASAISGISDADKDLWFKARELYIPSIVLVTDFESGEIDFEDMASIAGRILDPLVTPYLVLHDDSGAPIALIELETLRLYDYSNGKREIRDSESEHKILVQEFQTEFLEKIEEFGPTGFADALLFPAIPYLSKVEMGKKETLEYLAQLPVRS